MSYREKYLPNNVAMKILKEEWLKEEDITLPEASYYRMI
jgi:hypothetical protein